MLNTFCRFGYEKTFKDQAELDDYLALYNFTSVRIVPWVNSKLHKGSPLNFYNLVCKDTGKEYLTQDQVAVIEKANCDEERDFGCEFLIIA